MYYTDFTVEMTSTEMLDKALQNSTPKKYARLLLEGAEIIKQLRRERDEARKAAMRWTPMADRPPEENGKYLCVWQGKSIETGLFLNGHFRLYGENKDRLVSHWMPLPELPKETNEDE